MLQLSESLIQKPVLSLRTGGAMATTLSPIIDPNNLKIEGFYCQDRFEKRQPVLVTSDIRDILPQGLVVNDYDALTDPEELVRMKDVLEIGFELIGKPVFTVSKEKLGKVTDFAADSETLYIQKLYVSQSLLKSLSSGQLSIDRNQIIEITNKKVVVQDILQPTKAGSAVPVTPLA
jgi:uncharacterized protein YrrD